MTRTAAALALSAIAAFAVAPLPGITLQDGVFRSQPASLEATLQVFVDGRNDLPPLLGASSREHDALLFTPRFPLQPGLRYRAVYRDSHRSAPLVEIFSIPMGAAPPATRVSRIDPTGERVPENLLKIYLNFSAPMSRGEAYRFVRLLDESDRQVELPFLEIEQELWDPEARRLTLLFDPGRVKRDLVPHDEAGTPLRAGAAYTMVVDRGFPDAFGNPLENEARKTFRVGPPDYDPPRTSDWRLTSPKAGAREPLVVTFPDPLDRALLDRVLEVIDPSGEQVRGAASIEVNETRWSFRPVDPWKAGEHSLRALSILEDLAGNSLGQRFEVGLSERMEGRAPRAYESAKFRVEPPGTAHEQTGSQGGDQFLDGIGETGLIARYLFNGNAEDSSRNQLHATVRGQGGVFVDDGPRRVLLLTGEGSHAQLPASALSGEDALAVVGWLYLPTRASGPVFDFGQGPATRLFASVDAQGFRATAVVGGQVSGQTPPKPVVENQWVHFAVILDPARRELTTYIDGARAGQATEMAATLAELAPQSSTTPRLFLGRAQDDRAPTLHGRLRDVRLYRIALGDEPVATIRGNALAAAQPPRGRAATPEISTANIPRESPFAAGIVNVPDVTVETIVGMLPRLPPELPATYAGGAGALVRVIWPAPIDNVEVRKAGSYTVSGRVPGTRFEPKATVIVKVRVGTITPPDRLVESFPLSRVSLDRDSQGRDTPFIRNRDKFVRGLSASNPDSFLYNYRETFAEPQPEGARPLEGWDNQTTRLRGHASGHYLSAIAQAYASTGYDPALQATLLEKMNYLVDTLYGLSRKSGHPAQPGGPSVANPTAVPVGTDRQSYDSNLRAGAIRTDYWNWGAGFISAYPPDQFIMLERGATYGTQDSQIWAPYYTLHKILAGLLDTYEVAGNRKALEIARGMGEWVNARLSALPPETRTAMWSRYIAGEYGGMNEAMARLFRLTGERRFLDTARLFDNTNLFFGNASRDGGLARRVDTIRGKHANQHIPQITGALETFRNTAEMPYYEIASNFWDIVNDGYLYSIGGVAGARNPNNAECFPAQPGTLWENGLAAGGQNETCATYNLLKLDRQLFMYDQTAKYMDHYERALYNHILASVAEEDAGNTYHVPLNPGARKQFGNADMNGFTCCNGTALESQTKLQDTIYFRSADHRSLYVNLFIPSTLSWVERKVSLRQVTDFPYADTSRFIITGSGRFDVKVRVPGWATRGFAVKINGRDQAVKAMPGAYLTLSRAWRDQDTIEVRMPFTFRLDHLVDQPNVASLFYGPVLLAAEEPAARTDWRQVALDRNDISRSIAGDPGTLRFSIEGVPFKPFYETYGRHSVYLHVSFK